MNQKLILRIVGLILCIEALCMLPSLLLAAASGGEELQAFFVSAVLCGGVGGLLALIKPDDSRLQTRDGFVCVALCWIVLGLFGALPYVFSGCCDFMDAFFETVSGLTTTGATIFSAPSRLPRGIQLWRALTQWMGGMGILVLVLALLPKISEGSVNLMKAESPGPISTKLRPRTAETARILYRIYIALTAVEAVVLRVVGLPWFDALTTALTTISTGGFSIRDASIAYYQSSLINWILTFFMFAASVNFTLLFLLATRRFREALKSEELRVYTGIVVGSSLFIALDLVAKTGRSFGSALEAAAFQVTTLISTTGYCTEDFDLWPPFCRCILVLVMFCGGCAGSTAGGVKVSRLVLLVKGVRRDMRRIMHSREVRPITLDGQRVSEETLSSVSVFFFAYIAILLFGTLVVSLDGVEFTAAFTASLTAISNVGPGLGALGPTCNFGFLSDFSKLVLTLTMLLGRLEIMPLLVLMMPSVWRRK